MAHKWNEIKHKGDPARVAELRREMERELSLVEIRKARALTQKQLAAALDTTQGGISRLEHQTDLYVSTLRSYIEALGGRLELVAVFDDGAVQIGSFEELAEQPEQELVPA